MKSSRVALAMFLALSFVGTATTTAEAVTDEERAGARAAASAGADAFDAGRWAEAIDYFERAEAVIHSPVHLMYIARAQLKLGQYVKAGEIFIKIKNEGVPAGASAVARKAVDDAIVELEKLNTKMPYVVVKLEGTEGKKVKVTMDGREIPAVLVGIQRPVDPGTHKFRAFGDGVDTGEIALAIKEGARETVLLKPVPGDQLAANPPPATPATGPAPEASAGAGEPATAPASQPVPAEQDSGGGSNGLRLASYGAFGVGVVGLGAGIIFGLQAQSEADEADDLCGGSRERCAIDPASPQADEVSELNDASGSAQTLSIVGFAVGGLGIATGVTLLILSSGGSSEKAASPRVQPLIGYRSVGVSGRF